MAQFDPLILFTLTLSTIMILFAYYTILIVDLYPLIFIVKKFRFKKFSYNKSILQKLKMSN